MQLLKQGDNAATGKIWRMYFHRIVALARKHLGTSLKRVADEEDVAISAFQSFCQGAVAGNFARLEDRDDLWQVLAVITTRKAKRQIAQSYAQKRGGGHVRGESVFKNSNESHGNGLEQAAQGNVSPEFLAIVDDELQTLLKRLPDEQLRHIVLAKLEGYSNAEIAQQIGRHVRSVERKLQIIREYWEPDASDA